MDNCLDYTYQRGTKSGKQESLVNTFLWVWNLPCRPLKDCEMKFLDAE